MDTLRRERNNHFTAVIQYGQGYTPESYGTYTVDLGQWADFVQFTPYSGGASWRKSISQGLAVTTDLLGTNTTYSPGNCQFLIKKDEPDFLGNMYFFIFQGDTGAWLPAPIATQGTMSDADNIAKENIQSKILDVQRSFQTGVFLGEIRDTIRLIRNPTSVLFDKTSSYLGSVKKRAKREKSLKGKKQMVSDLWLQYSFGVAPLLKDIDSGAKAASEILTYRMPRKTVSAKGVSYGSSQESTIDGNISLLGLKLGTRVKAQVEVKYKAQIAVSNDTKQDDLESLGLTWGNFLPTVWELIPYSFLVDYFTNVGKVIDSLAVNHSRINWCVKGTRSSITSEMTFIKGFFHPNYGSAGYSWLAQRDGKLPSLERTEVSRSNGFISAPAFRLRNPFEGTSTNVQDKDNKRFYNLAALAVSHREAVAALR